MDWRVDDGTLRRFWDKVSKGPGCWEWTGAKRNQMGHGSFWFEGSVMYAHRVSYVIHKGPIPAGMMVCHRCDNPPCVRPDHLFLGSRADNNRDMFRKGRASTVRVKGEAHYKAQITDADVVRIMAEASLGASQRSLARRYGVSQTQIWRVVHGESRTSAPHAVLARHAGVSEDDVRRNAKKVYLAAAKAAHPDAGGSAEAWGEVQDAARALGVG